MSHSRVLQTDGVPMVVFTPLVQYVVGGFYTVINILDPYSLTWQRKNSNPYLTVAFLPGQPNDVGREYLFPGLSWCYSS